MAEDNSTLYVYWGQAILGGTLAWTWLVGPSPRAYEIPSMDKGHSRDEAVKVAQEIASKKSLNRVVVLKQGGQQDYIIDIRK